MKRLMRGADHPESALMLCLPARCNFRGTQGGYDQREYDDRTDDFGYRRDSDGFSLAAGMRGTLGSHFTREVLAGWRDQNYRDPRLRDDANPRLSARVGLTGS